MRLLRFLTAGLAALMILPALFDRNGNSGRAGQPSGRPLRCVICLGESGGYLTGYNHGLLKAFGESLGGPVSIILGDEGASYSDSLLLDSLDVAVIPASAFDESRGTVPVALGDTSFVWEMRPGKGGEAVRWFALFKGTDRFKDLDGRFFHREPSAISPYDDLFRKASGIPGWDWRLLAALAWSESRFKVEARSPRGALGIMQMMPVTAGKFGVTDALDPEENIMAAARYLSFLQKTLRSYTDDPETLVWLTISAYNSGGGRALRDIEGGDMSSATTAYTKATLNKYDMFRGLPPRYQEDGNETIEP
ncbi:MAG: transglycosylase SLT domain-containing protein [Bacteroidales bacterium]|nr:transglycosylase SLT domain-containing protein [Bacteroidales bacterium]